VLVVLVEQDLPDLTIIQHGMDHKEETETEGEMAMVEAMEEAVETDPLEELEVSAEWGVSDPMDRTTTLHGTDQVVPLENQENSDPERNHPD